MLVGLDFMKAIKSSEELLVLLVERRRIRKMEYWNEYFEKNRKRLIEENRPLENLEERFRRGPSEIDFVDSQCPGCLQADKDMVVLESARMCKDCIKILYSFEEKRLTWDKKLRASDGLDRCYLCLRSLDDLDFAVGMKLVFVCWDCIERFHAQIEKSGS